jgi:hypothetical protein
MPYTGNVLRLQNRAVFQPRPVDHVMSLQPRMRQQPLLVIQLHKRIRRKLQRPHRQIPPIPAPRRRNPHLSILRGQQLVVAFPRRTAPVLDGQVVDKRLVRLRVDARCPDGAPAPLVLERAGRVDASQDETSSAACG